MTFSFMSDMLPLARRKGQEPIPHRRRHFSVAACGAAPALPQVRGARQIRPPRVRQPAPPSHFPVARQPQEGTMGAAFERIVIVMLENSTRENVLANPYMRSLREKGVFLAN